MSYKAIYNPEALDEYKDAVSWYLERSDVAAEKFAAAINEKVKEICKDAYRYKTTYSFFKETSLKKFPFNIVYFIDENIKAVIISSIFHHRRNPKKKFKK
ncbi:MAG: type II toxin-antitoxin system RelE/ParE family toxin [Sphingobacteriales bacterium]|nr:type II toxin-antitoxin system RelE/ParE family toxin [Sphingobacteriales bacterium]MBI3718814.1 type II toxin-antitoxin system RelE/ParE family toxin [Sphingobacteriales bacterium]